MSSRRVRIFQSTGSGVPADYCGSERDVPCDLLRAVPMLAPDEKNRDGRLSLPKQMDCRIYQRSTSHWLLCSAPEHEGDPNQQHSDARYRILLLFLFLLGASNSFGVGEHRLWDLCSN